MRVGSTILIMVFTLIGIGFLLSDSLTVRGDLQRLTRERDALGQHNAELQKRLSILEKQLEACKAETSASDDRDSLQLQLHEGDYESNVAGLKAASQFSAARLLPPVIVLALVYVIYRIAMKFYRPKRWGHEDLESVKLTAEEINQIIDLRRKQETRTKTD